MMTKQEVRLIEDIFLKLRSQSNNLNILEWGSGGSTVYYTNFLRENGIEYQWLSLEYNKMWAEKIARETADDRGVTVKLFDVGNTKLKQRKIPMNEYVDYPATLGKEFDFILVDGRKRRRCLLEAAKLLKPGGIVVLHDAEREYYYCAFDAFHNKGEFIGRKLWVGKIHS